MAMLANWKRNYNNKNVNSVISIYFDTDFNLRKPADLG